MHDEATVAKTAGTPAAAPDPTGTVSFTLYTGLTCNGALVPGGVTPDVPLSSGMAASGAVIVAPGVYSYLAHYNGDSNNPALGGARESLTITEATAATFRWASASTTARGVVVRWRTGAETGLLGFHVYRSRGHSWQRLTRSLIAAKGSVSGASYRFLDRTAKRGVAYRYRIWAVNRDGTTAWFGPVRVT